MPRKNAPKAKDAAVEKAGPKPIQARKSKKLSPENISEEGTLRIDELSLTKLLRYEAEERAARSTIQNMQINLAKITQQIDPQGILARMRDEIRAHEQKRLEYEEEYKSLKKRIEEKLKIDLSRVSYDDVTGVIFEMPNPEKDAQASVKK